MKSPIEQLDKLARYLIHNYGDMVRVDDMPNEDAVDEAIKILEQQRHLSGKCSGRDKVEAVSNCTCRKITHRYCPVHGKSRR